jgi:IclR family acetate operon transcriptional repressor
VSADNVEKKVAEFPYIQSLDRGLAVIRAVANSSEPVTLGELTELLGIDRSNALRLAHTLRRRGFLSSPAGRKDYILGSAMWTLSRQYDWTNMLVRVARQELSALAQTVNETAHLAIQEGRNALFIDSVHSRRAVVVAGQTGALVPLYSTAHGKALLADLGQNELRSIFGSEPLQNFAKPTIKTIAALATECACVQERGYALDEAEFIEGMCCVAAPIRSNDGMVVGSVGISAPASRFRKDQLHAHSKSVVQCAGMIGQLLSASEELEQSFRS